MSTVHKEVDLSGKQCRICYLNADRGNDGGDEVEVVVVVVADDLMELGCKCKGDLATAHLKCALTWFLIKGNFTCEICGSVAQNVGAMARNAAVQQTLDVNVVDVEIQALEEIGPISEPGSEIALLREHNFVLVLLCCAVIAFTISLLFHFNDLR